MYDYVIESISCHLRKLGTSKKLVMTSNMGNNMLQVNGTFLVALLVVLYSSTTRRVSESTVQMGGQILLGFCFSSCGGDYCTVMSPLLCRPQEQDAPPQLSWSRGSIRQ